MLIAKNIIHGTISHYVVQKKYLRFYQTLV